MCSHDAAYRRMNVWCGWLFAVFSGPLVGLLVAAEAAAAAASKPSKTRHEEPAQVWSHIILLVFSFGDKHVTSQARKRNPPDKAKAW
jgi:hypothetical protein